MLKKEDGKIKIESFGTNITQSTIDAVESFMKEVEGLSIPFGDGYWIEKKGGNTSETSCYSIVLRVMNHNISDSGLEKLKDDIGKERVETEAWGNPIYRSLQISLIDKL